MYTSSSYSFKNLQGSTNNGYSDPVNVKNYRMFSFLLFQWLKLYYIHVIIVGDAHIASSSKVRNSGVIFYDNLSMNQHISKVCRTAYFHLHNIAWIRNYLTHDAACSLIHAFVTSHIDYCNSLMYGSPSYLIKKLQRVQNSAARVVFCLRKCDHITPALIQLHWLPVELRIHFKVLLIVFKIMHNMAPKYLEKLIEVRAIAPYQLRSHDGLKLRTPSFNCKTFGGRAFPVFNCS